MGSRTQPQPEAVFQHGNRMPRPMAGTGERGHFVGFVSGGDESLTERQILVGPGVVVGESDVPGLHALAQGRPGLGDQLVERHVGNAHGYHFVQARRGIGFHFHWKTEE